MMLKRKPLIFFTLVFAIVALFAVSEVMAFCDYCDPPVDSLTVGDWTITLVSRTQISTDPVLWKWHYTVKESNNNFKGINYLAMLIPDCCNEPAITVDVGHGQNQGFKWTFAVGEGEPTDGIGYKNLQAFVVKGTPDDSIDWYLITNTDVRASSTIVLKVRKVGALAFEMAVPGCAATAGGGVTFTSCVNWYGDPQNPNDDISLQVTRMGDAQGCIVPPVEFYVGIGCDQDAPRQEISGEQLAQAIEGAMFSDRV
jgi:hypothetical protein